MSDSENSNRPSIGRLRKRRAVKVNGKRSLRILRADPQSQLRPVMNARKEKVPILVLAFLRAQALLVKCEQSATSDACLICQTLGINCTHLMQKKASSLFF